MANPFKVAALKMRAMHTGAPRQQAYYAAGATDRLNADWLMPRISADQVLRVHLQTLRNRGRDLTMNNGSASAVPKLFSENVIGKDGVVMQARIESTRGDLHAQNNKKIQDAWEAWCEPQNCSADGRSSWVDLQALIAESEATDGEVLIHIIRGFPNGFGFALELIDPDRLDHTYNVLASRGQNEIRLGVEVDEWNRALAYWLWAKHPTEPGGMQRVRVPADDIIHIFLQLRPGQTRGVTWFAPIVTDLHMLGGYRTAEVMAARVGAAKMGFFEYDADKAGPLEPTPDNTTDGGSDTSRAKLPMSAEPATFEQLPYGYSFKEWNPTHPSTAFEAFDKTIMRTIATALRVSYMSLSSNLEGTSFGSGRIGLLAEQATYQKLQKRFITQVATRVYREWLRMALLSGALVLDSLDVARYHNVVWHPRAFPWIDPEKDITAAAKEVAMGIQSLTALAAARGRDIEEVLKERAAEIALAEQYKVPIFIDAPGRATPLDTEAPATTPDNSGGGARGSVPRLLASAGGP